MGNEPASRRELRHYEASSLQADARGEASGISGCRVFLEPHVEAASVRAKAVGSRS